MILGHPVHIYLYVYVIMIYSLSKRLLCFGSVKERLQGDQHNLRTGLYVNFTKDYKLCWNHEPGIFVKLTNSPFIYWNDADLCGCPCSISGFGFRYNAQWRLSNDMSYHMDDNFGTPCTFLRRTVFQVSILALKWWIL